MIKKILRFVLVISSCVFLHRSEASERPNIILIMADDLGVEGLNCYGGTSYRTPRLDRLAAEGMRFTHAYAQPLCTNTRIQLMTGFYNHRNWLYFGCLDPKAKTFGHYLSDTGYKTCMVGKWQLQSYDPPDYPGGELRRGKGMKVGDAGFSDYSLWHTGHTEDKGYRYADPTIFENGRFRTDTKGRYGPDIWVSHLEELLKQQKDDDQPLFIYYAMALPHWPFVPTPHSDDWGIAERQHPPLGTTGGDTKYFADMVAYVDEAVGRVVDAVDRNDRGKDTLILFYGDNGTDRRVTSQTIFGKVAGGKGTTTNAGTHVPLIARWTGRIRPGTLNDNLVDSTDFLPTLLEAAGQGVPTDGDQPLDGISFFGQLLGKRVKTRPWVFCHYDPRPGWDKDKYRLVRFARDRRFKLYGDGRLFDIPADIREQRPLQPAYETAEANAARVRLGEVLKAMRVPK